MSGVIAQRWQALAARERRWVVAGAVAGGLLLGWAWLWHPLALSRDALRAEAAANAAALEWMRPAAQQAAASGGLRLSQNAADGRSLLARVDAGAREAGLAGGLTGVEPLGADRVRARFSAVAFNPLVVWLESAAGQGLVVDEMAFRRAGSNGVVDGQMVVRQEVR
ncbi:MAG: hypothetical protein CVV17_12400 [Gammaproteobacteria bacterium HGW-Gammaproteobacteria-7]|nr:MAG: hypothetical protein CVV17_12400 [Gammaproteobacteria bacterium HGW-Gammaproteobacteria-7]